MGMQSCIGIIERWVVSELCQVQNIIGVARFGEGAEKRIFKRKMRIINTEKI